MSKKQYSANWMKGYEAGKNMAQSLGRPIMGYDFPKEFSHRGSAWSCGYAEACLTYGMKPENKNQ